MLIGLVKLGGKMKAVEQVKEVLSIAKEAVEELPDGELKIKAFEVILQHLLVSNISTNLNYVRRTGDDPKTATIESGLNTDGDGNVSVDHAKIVEKIKTCDEVDSIERKILSRSSQVNRTLLPLYIVHEYFTSGFGLSSGDIAKITTDLGIPIAVANASGTLSGKASKYVIGDSIRKKGGVVKYKLHKRGVDYMKSVIEGTSNQAVD